MSKFRKNFFELRSLAKALCLSTYGIRGGGVRKFLSKGRKVGGPCTGSSEKVTAKLVPIQKDFGRSPKLGAIA